MEKNRSQKNNTLRNAINGVLLAAFQKCGYKGIIPQTIRSKAPIAADFQCNDVFALAKKQNASPMAIAEKIAAELRKNPMFGSVETAQPGFINLNLTDGFLADHFNKPQPKAIAEKIENIILDFGGANVAKPLHVGHLRSAIIGESLKRIGRYLGHNVIGDVHLGDWGLQMGMLIKEMKRRQPDLPYFNPELAGPYPKESPVTIADLDELYPAASQRTKDDENFLIAARKATVELQRGRPGYRALWRHFVDVSVADVKRDYADLGISFDLWLGESDAHETVVPLVEKLLKKKLAYKSEGAIIMDVAESKDAKELPPILLINSEGAELYAGTDLATIAMRMAMEKKPDRIIYVVDKRQSLHFDQVFRAVRKAEIIGEKPVLEHVGFGTMNGTDNKPFKTRAGGTMKLKELLAMIRQQAETRLAETGQLAELKGEQRQEIATLVGLATLKFADLSNYRESDYVFDLQRFSSFEGCTGPYLLYSAVRAKAILEKAAERNLAEGKIAAPAKAAEREILLNLDGFGETVSAAWQKRAPSVLAEYAYRLANSFNSFYHECPVINEEDKNIQASRLAIVGRVRQALEQTLLLLGIEIPERM